MQNKSHEILIFLLTMSLQCVTITNVSRENVLSGVALGGRSRKGELMKIVLKIFLVVVILLVALKLNAM